MAAKLYGIVPDDTMVAEIDLPEGAIAESQEDREPVPAPAAREGADCSKRTLRCFCCSPLLLFSICEFG